ncbi:hypothetical protein STEG23_029826, partial [Scotinomys teguina]
MWPEGVIDGCREGRAVRAAEAARAAGGTGAAVFLLVSSVTVAVAVTMAKATDVRCSRSSYLRFSDCPSGKAEFLRKAPETSMALREVSTCNKKLGTPQSNIEKDDA